MSGSRELITCCQITFGNSLRWTLLSSIPGVVVTSIKIEYEGRGDRDGLMERACDRAAELYARACREGRPDVGALAAWLAQFRLEVLSCPELALTDFLPALGEEGLAVYREAVEAAP